MQAATASGSFEIDDYFKLNHVLQLALSPDGRRLAYVVEHGSGLSYYTDQIQSKEKRDIRKAYLLKLAGNSKPAVLDGLADAQGLAWIGRTNKLAFLSSRSGAAQVYSYDPNNGQMMQLTHSTDPIEAFSFSTDGATLAYMTRKPVDVAKSFYQRFRSDSSGVLVDTDDITSADFVDPSSNSTLRPNPAVLWALPADGDARKVPVPGNVKAGFFWSSDARLLSVTFVSDDVKSSLAGCASVSLGVFNITSRMFRAIGKAIEPQGSRAAVCYSGGAWLPHTHKLLLLRLTDTNPWVSPGFPDAAIVDVTNAQPLNRASWQPVYIYRIDPAFFPVNESRVLIENVVEGVRGLFELTPKGLRKSPLMTGVDGESSKLRLSSDFSTLAFVNESLTRPQEIYIRQGRAAPRKLTDLNDKVDEKVQFTSRALVWKSVDGATVKGWLLEPPASFGTGPKPLIAVLHGGPGYAFPNAFAPYFDGWPYPFEVLATRGTAIFVPNYRGTETYGRAHTTPKRLDLEPVDDIVTGVKQLISQGVADPQRLGIAGHSHGAWLGPMTMAREKIFRAGSFAEGWANNVVMYELMKGDHNRRVHDPMFGRGRSLYDSPQPYVESSPDLNFKGVRTATLFEAGAYGQAIMMFGLPKALRHFGTPAEFIIYPQTEHSPNATRIQRESAMRNLQWFSYWLNGQELDDPVDADQYERWSRMRFADGQARHARSLDDIPSITDEYAGYRSGHERKRLR